MFKKSNGLNGHKHISSPADSVNQDSAGNTLAKALSGFGPGQKVVIVGHPGGRQLWAKMESLGLTPGTEITVVANSGNGPLLLAVESSRFVLGRGMAQAILAIASSQA